MQFIAKYEIINKIIVNYIKNNKKVRILQCDLDKNYPGLYVLSIYDGKIVCEEFDLFDFSTDFPCIFAHHSINEKLLNELSSTNVIITFS